MGTRNSSQVIPPLPEGFTLQQLPKPPKGFEVQNAAPDLPPGFTIQDAPPIPEGFTIQGLSTPEALEASSTLDENEDEDFSILDNVVAGYKEFRASQKVKSAIRHLQGKQFKNSAFAPSGPLSEGLTGTTFFEDRFEEEQATKLKEANALFKEAANTPMTQRTQRMLTAPTFGEAWEHLKKAPLDIIVELGARSAINSAPGLVAGTLGGIVAGPIGFAAGVGAGSANVEYAHAIVEALKNEGVEPTNIDAVRVAIKDKALMQRVEDFASTRATIIGSVDALTGGIASKTIAPKIATTQLAKQAINIPLQLAIQATGGGTGEALAQQATTGEIVAGEVVGEAVGELIGAPAEVVMAAISTKKGAGLSDEARAIIDLDKTLEETEAVLKKTAESDVGVANIEKILDQEALQDTLKGVVVSPQEAALADQVVLDSGKTINQSNLQAGDVVTAGFNEAEMDFMFTEQEIDDVTMSDDLSDIKDERIIELNLRQERNKKAMNLQRTVKTKLKSVVDSWVSSYAPNMKVVLSSGVESQFNESLAMKSDSFGQMVHIGNDTHVISLNLNAFTNFNETEQVNENALIEATAHEFGHAVASHLFSKADPTTRQALFNEFKKSLRVADQKTQPLQNILRKVNTPAISNLERKAVNNKNITPPIGKGNIDTFIKDARKRGALNYYLSFDEWFANEAVRHLTNEKTGKGPLHTFFTRVGNVLKRFYERFKETWGATKTFEAYMDNIAAQVQRQRITNEIAKVQNAEDFEATINNMSVMAEKVVSSKKLGIPGSQRKAFKESMDKFGTFIKWSHTLIQLATKNPHIEGLQSYLKSVQDWWNTKSKWSSRADDRLRAWRNLGKDQSQRLARFLLDVTQESELKARKLTTEELQTVNKRKHNSLNEESLKVFNEVQGDFEAALKALQDILIEEAKVTFAENPTTLGAEISRIQGEFTRLGDRNFFPLSRFGKYTVRMKANEPGKLGKKGFAAGDTVIFETYDSTKQQQIRRKELTAQYPQHTISSGVLDETTETFAGMPRQLIERVLNTEGLDLTPEQRQTLSELSFEMSPAQSYKKHLMHRKGIAGFSLDAMRGYASYFSHFSNHISRAKHGKSLSNAIRNVYQDVRSIQDLGGDATKRGLIANHLKAHRDYIFNPANEWANLRALGFLNYIGYNVKSAYINLTQVPLVTYPYLAARESINPGKIGVRDAKALASIAKAYKDVTGYITNNKGLTAEDEIMMNTLKEQGVIDESFAMMLAGLAEGSMLQRMMPGAFGKSQKAQELIRNISYYGAFMFQAAEKYNRRVTALAAFRMAQEAQKTNPDIDPIEEAKIAVQTTQLEYAKWNRAKFMQGKKGVLFLFWGYIQGMLHFASHDPGAIRYLLLLGATAGLTGLPFAEDLADLLDFAGSKIKGTKVDTKLLVRNLISGLGVEPDIVMNGLSSHYGLGPLHALELAGIPIPNVDVSGSLSMGSVVPGVTPLTKSGSNPQATLSNVAKEAGGAVVAIPISLYQALNDPNPDKWKAYERAFPIAMKNVSKAIRMGQTGHEVDRTGAPIVDAQGNVVEFNLEDTRQRLELIFQGLGFPSTRLNEAQELSFTQREHILFYELRRRDLAAAYDYARRIGNTEGVADVRKAIEHYNNSVPHSRLRLSIKSLARSIRQRQRGRNRVERGLPQQRTDTQLFESVRDDFQLETEEL